MKNSALALIICVIAITFSGCAQVDSEDIRTSGIYTETTVTAKDESTTVSVRMRTGRALGADRIILSSGDQLSATLSGNIVALSNSADSSSYRATFNESIGSSEIKVSLSRANDTDAPNSVVALPNYFEITAPDAGTTFTAGESITAAWSPAESANTVNIEYRFNCQATSDNGPRNANHSREYTVVDSGTHTATINEILNVSGTQNELVSGISCPLEVTVTRTNAGSLDSALTKGGTIRANREKSVLVNVVP